MVPRKYFSGGLSLAGDRLERRTVSSSAIENNLRASSGIAVATVLGAENQDKDGAAIVDIVSAGSSPIEALGRFHSAVNDLKMARSASALKIDQSLSIEEFKDFLRSGVLGVKTEIQIVLIGIGKNPLEISGTIREIQRTADGQLKNIMLNTKQGNQYYPIDNVVTAKILFIPQASQSDGAADVEVRPAPAPAVVKAETALVEQLSRDYRRERPRRTTVHFRKFLERLGQLMVDRSQGLSLNSHVLELGMRYKALFVRDAKINAQTAFWFSLVALGDMNVGQLVNASDEELLKIKGFGPKKIEILDDALIRFGWRRERAEESLEAVDREFKSLIAVAARIDAPLPAPIIAKTSNTPSKPNFKNTLLADNPNTGEDVDEAEMEIDEVLAQSAKELSEVERRRVISNNAQKLIMSVAPRLPYKTQQKAARFVEEILRLELARESLDEDFDISAEEWESILNKAGWIPVFPSESAIILDNLNIKIFQDDNNKDYPYFAPALRKSLAVTLKKINSQLTPAVASSSVGGIDFDPAKMNLQIRRDGRGVPLPLPEQNLREIDIQGLFPIIINFIPINAQTLPLLFAQSP